MEQAPNQTYKIKKLMTLCTLACRIVENHRLNLRFSYQPYKSKDLMFEFLLITPREKLDNILI